MLVVRRQRISKGKGLINTLIDKLPFELHLPGGYRYCGPGTKLEKRLKRGDRGINPLDEACKLHDIEYSKHADLESRERADRELEERAWQRVKSSDATLGERIGAWTVTTAMRAKQKIGAGMKKKKNCAVRRKAAGGGIKKPTVKKIRKRTTKRKIPGVRVIPLPKRGGILQYLVPLLTGLSNIGSVAGTASDLLKTIQRMKGSGLKKRAVLAPFKRGFGLYLRPYNPNE